MPEVSVIIATRDRSASVERTLESLRQVAPPSSGWEVIVADNGSTDQTPDVVAAAAEAVGSKVRYVRHAEGGKSAALNRAIALASGDILAFTDDDALPDPTWLAEVAREFREDPALALLGGRIELADPADLPMAIRPSRERQGVTRRTYDPGYPPIIGCNMAFRADALRSLGGFDERLGPGTPIVAEDVDLVYRACRAGLRVVYSPAPLVLHRHGRRTPDDRQRAMRTYLRGRGAFYAKHAGHDWRVARHAVRELATIAGEFLTGTRNSALGVSPRERLALLREGARLFRGARAPSAV